MEEQKATNEFKIEKGIPMPTKRSSIDYPFEHMEIGDSFEFSGKKGIYAKVYSSSKYFGEKFGRVFNIRKMRQENDLIFYRIWRIEN